MPGKSSTDIAAHVRRAIEDGTYKQFDRLPPSREMADTLGVARNTLRDALYRLQKEGLLDTRPGSGTYVTAAKPDAVPAVVSETAPLELIDARFALEPHICRLCVLHGRREDFDGMEELCLRMEAAVDEPVKFAETDTAFHNALAEATGNNLLIWLIGHITTVRSLDEWDRMRQVTLDSSIIRQYNAQHRDILNALRAREPERAAMKMKEHLETARLSLTRAADA